MLIKNIHLKIDTTLLLITIVLTGVGNLLTIVFWIIPLLFGLFLLSLEFITIYFHCESVVSRRPNFIMTGFLMMSYTVPVGFSFVLIIYLIQNDMIIIAN